MWWDMVGQNGIFSFDSKRSSLVPLERWDSEIMIIRLRLCANPCLGICITVLGREVEQGWQVLALSLTRYIMRKKNVACGTLSRFINMTFLHTVELAHSYRRLYQLSARVMSMCTWTYMVMDLRYRNPFRLDLSRIGNKVLMGIKC